MKRRFKALRGTRDILPDEAAIWQFAERTVQQVFPRYGFREMRTPAMEATELFTRSVGESSDIVRKEMYTLTRSRESMTLRPENTAPVVRAFVEHALHRGVAEGYPERYYYVGPMFRHERPQKGRQRQFHQVGVEVLGCAAPLVDAETMQMLDQLLEELGLRRRTLLLGTVGDETCRPGYRQVLRDWLEPRLPGLCEDCNRRYVDNPLRVLDCKVDADRVVLAAAPRLSDHLCTSCYEHFGAVRALLDRYGLSYELDERLVRGLDYYRRTVFEVVAEGLGAQNAVAGGGRYDGLVAELGGPDLPGFGFAMGLERLVMLLDPARAAGRGIDVALIALGPAGFEACIGMAHRFRRRGLRVMMPVVERSMGAQLKRADRAAARWAVFVGEEELRVGRFGTKNLTSGEQESLDERAILERLGMTDE